MASIFCCGGECGRSEHWNNFISVICSFDTGTVRSGQQSIRVNLTNDSGGMLTVSAQSSADRAIRSYVYFAQLPDNDMELAGASSPARGIWFVTSDNTLRTGENSTTFAASGISVTTGQWYRLDVKLTSTTIDGSVDGVPLEGLTGTYGAFTGVSFANAPTANSNCDLFVDDVLITDTSADYPLGAGRVLSYIPNADGTHNVAGANDFEKTLTGTDITNSTTDAWQLIDERPLPTTAVDFINAPAPPNATDYVEWQYEDSVEGQNPQHVEALLVVHDFGGAGTNDYTVTLREHLGGTSGNIFAGVQNTGASLLLRRAPFPTVPGTSDAWTETKFNALRSRFLVADASPDPYIDAAMLEAAFASAAPPPERVPRFTPYPQLLAH